MTESGVAIEAANVPLAVAMSAAVDALASVSREPQVYRALDDAGLLDLTRVAADEVRLAQLHVSLLAGEIARRSAAELGGSGLAQRRGHRTPEELVRVTTGTRAADARAAVRVGLTAGGVGDGSEGGSGGTALGTAVLEGRTSVAVADAVATGLGPATEAVSAEVLEQAIEKLLPRIDGLDADRAGREARALRDELDLDGLSEREDARREQRSLTIGRRADGMGWARWVLDPETFAVVSEVFDRVTSPRRVPCFGAGGGPDTDASATLEDSRTTAQRASDVFAELLRQGVAADSSQLLEPGPVGVRVLVSEQALTEGRGRGYLEGSTEAVSLATVQRHACAAGVVALLIDSSPDNAGQPLNLGRERRLFSRAQRLALAARDGGCRWPGCERPPSWCEAHHIEHWHRDGGRTDVADGVLLCRHHHLLAHNNGWEIRRAGPRYLLIPPDSVGANARPIDMPSRSRALHDVLSA